MTRLFSLATLAVISALVLAACGGSSSGGSSSSSTTSTSAAQAATSSAVPVITSKSSSLGTFLVDAKGRTLYLFEADKGPMSACAGACASVWPPLKTTGKPSAGAGVTASKLGTTKRSDGATEVTYNGHPLYTYAGDSAPGQTSGQGLDDYGAEWYALSAGGSKIDNG